MTIKRHFDGKKFQLFNLKNLHSISQLESAPKELVHGIEIAATVFPFRTNNYVVDELIDWQKVPDDPIFRLTFPNRDMLDTSLQQRIRDLIRCNASESTLQRVVQRKQMKLNPHPAGQAEMNVPVENGKTYSGMQHKYPETILFFPSQGQTCHSYCTYCFRWAQFAKIDTHKFMSKHPQELVEYLSLHPEATDVLFTGGDPLTMSTRLLRRYVEPLITKKPGGLTAIRFGSKALAYWPYRFLTDKDADDLLRLFEEITDSDLHLTIMAHFSHPRELETPAVQAAIGRIRSTGAQIRCQAPLVRHVNDDPEIWRRMWQQQVRMGAVPYYMFVARNTGAQKYFKVSLADAFRIFSEAYNQVSGLCRTVRGPSMSATPGKILVDGVTEINGERVFALKFLQGRNPEWVNRIFFAKHDPEAAWLDELRPAFGEKRFFFQPDLRLLTSPDREDRSA